MELLAINHSSPERRIIFVPRLLRLSHVLVVLLLAWVRTSQQLSWIRRSGLAIFPGCQGLFIYLLKPFLPLVHKIAFANTFQLYHKIKYNIIYYIFLHIKHPQSVSPIFLILFLNLNYESLDFTTAGRLFHMAEPRK